MNLEKKLLDKFGEILVSQLIDRHCKGNKKVIESGFKNSNKQDFNEVFDKLNTKEKHKLYLLFKDTIDAIVFDFLRIFEENEQFKLIYEEDGKQFDLNKISEMLKAETIIEGGWIERFSKELKNDA